MQHNFSTKSKKILNLCLTWHILRSYRFVADVTFNMHTHNLCFSRGTTHNGFAFLLGTIAAVFLDITYLFCLI